MDTVRLLEPKARKFSSPFLDSKGGFNNFNADILCASLRSTVFNHCLVSSVRSLWTERLCRLLFEGSITIDACVSVGTPKASPVSPLLFVIYVASLPISIERGPGLSYVHNLSLTVYYPSYRCNSKVLESAFGLIRAIPHTTRVDFSIPKPALNHCHTLI